VKSLVSLSLYSLFSQTGQIKTELDHDPLARLYVKATQTLSLVPACSCAVIRLQTVDGGEVKSAVICRTKQQLSPVIDRDF
jgi:hypothetical protein